MTTKHPPARVAVSPSEAGEMLGVTRKTIYGLIDEGRLRRFHVGTRALIPVADVLAIVGGEPDVTPLPGG